MMRKTRHLKINEELLAEYIQPLVPERIFEDFRAELHQAIAMRNVGGAEISTSQGSAIEAWLSDQVDMLELWIDVNLGLLGRFVKGNDEDLSFRLWGLNLDFIAGWFSENSHRFHIAPHIVTQDDDHVEIGFSGLCPAIRFWISPQTATVSVEYSGECWDLLADFDLAPKETSEGRWINSLAPEERQVSYPDLQSIWIHECGKPLMEWCEQNLLMDGSLWLLDLKPGTATWARISPTCPSLARDQEVHLVAHSPLYVTGTLMMDPAP